jgi:hypothetical protein
MNTKHKAKKPEGFENDLGEYGPQVYDGYCGEPIMWGFPIINHLGEERFSQLRSVAKLECCYPNWYVIVATITRKDAIKKYGKVTNETFGPRGGWKTVTFGTTTFIHTSVKA